MAILRTQQYVTVPFTLLLLFALLPSTTLAAPKVFTMGDSFSVGTGIHLNPFKADEFVWSKQTLGNGTDIVLGGDALCMRELDTTPGARLAQEQDLEAEMVACGRAVVLQDPNLQDQWAYLIENNKDEQVVKFSGSTILLTIGLNDLRPPSGKYWYEVLLGCLFQFSIFPKKDDACASDPDNNQVINIEEIKTAMTESFQMIITDASEASIRILGYGKLFQRNGDNCNSFRVSNELADLMDDVYFGAANAASAEVVADLRASNPGVDIQFVDPDDYLTIGSCGKFNAKEQQLLGYQWFLPFASFHPTQLGYTQYYRALVESL